MNNRGSRRNTGNYIAIKGICETPSDDIKEEDVYKDYLYKIQSYIEQNDHHLMGTYSEPPKTLNEANTMLPIDDQLTIDNMWSQDQDKAVAKAITLGRATGFRDGSYTNNRSTVACIVEENNNA